MPAANTKVDKSAPAGRYRDVPASIKVWELERPLKILDFDTEDELNFGLDRYGKRRNSRFSDASREEGETSSSWEGGSVSSRSDSEPKRRSKPAKDRRKRSARLYSSSESDVRENSKRTGGRRRSASYSSEGEDSMTRVPTHSAVPKTAEELRKMQIAKDLGLVVAATTVKSLKELEAKQMANKESFIASKQEDLIIDPSRMHARSRLKQLSRSAAKPRRRRG